MKAFLTRLLLFLLPVIVAYLALAFEFGYTSTLPKNDFMAAIIDKHKILNSIKQPRVIITGGSNTAFGINSVEIEKQVKMPVVNLGLHAGLGLNFVLNELRHSVREGDIIFLSIEYYLTPDGDYKLKYLTGNFFNPANDYFTHNLLNDLSFNLSDTRKKTKELLFPSPYVVKKNEVYKREAFNDHGDVISHLDEKSPEVLLDKSKFTYSYWKGIELLNSFYEEVSAKKCKVYFLYPNLPQTEYDVNKEVFQKYAADISSDLKFQVINTPSDFVMPDSLFYDTIYHLNKEGREQRTTKLIEIIKKYIPQPL